MKKIIALNWKMYLTGKAVQELSAKIDEEVSHKEKELFEVIIFPSLAHYAYIVPPEAILLGGQYVSIHEEGAHTGQSSARDLKELGCTHVLVGHSETRAELGDTEEKIVKKMRRVIEAGMIPILCVGETEAERKENKTTEVLGNQLSMAMFGIDPNCLVIIAYEPVWSIGTGRNCPAEEAARAIVYIKEKMKELGFTKYIYVLYGGSITSTIASDYIRNDEIDGLLIGKAGTSFDEVKNIMSMIQ